MVEFLHRAWRTLLAGCCGVGVVVGSAASASSADAVQGKVLVERWCAACHLANRDQKRATDEAPPFASIAKMPDFDAKRLAFLLLKPHPNMPALSLSRTEIADIADYVATLK